MTEAVRFLIVGDGNIVHRISSKYAEFALCGEYIKNGKFNEPISIPLHSLNLISNGKICSECKYEKIGSWAH